MSMTKRFTRWLRRARLHNAERELAFLEERAPTALVEARHQVETLRARVRADLLIASAEGIAARIERQIKKSGVLA